MRARRALSRRLLEALSTIGTKSAHWEGACDFKVGGMQVEMLMLSGRQQTKTDYEVDIDHAVGYAKLELGYHDVESFPLDNLPRRLQKSKF